ncbi:MAG TPA: DNA-protecting protein DprA, partial [Sphingomonas sp.]|nr:DNA-protecting protein DprA [Sphingomonas sp.]
MARDDAAGEGGDVRADRIARLRLIRTPGVGPVSYAQLLARFGTPADALAAIPDLARRGGGKPPVIPSIDVIEREVAAVERAGARYLFLGLSGYPATLATIPSA